MGSAKTYLIPFLFIFSFSVISVSAQNRVQQLHSRSLMDGAKELEPSKKIFINVYGKDHQSLKDSYIQVIGTDLEFEANDEGLVLIELPANLRYEKVELRITGKNHISKIINISFYDFEEGYKTIQLKKRPHGFRTIVCPTF